MMSYAIAKFSDMSKVFIDISLILSLSFVGENLQKGFSAPLVIPLCKKE